MTTELTPQAPLRETEKVFQKKKIVPRAEMVSETPEEVALLREIVI